VRCVAVGSFHHSIDRFVSSVFLHRVCLHRTCVVRFGRSLPHHRVAVLFFSSFSIFFSTIGTSMYSESVLFPSLCVVCAVSHNKSISWFSAAAALLLLSLLRHRIIYSSGWFALRGVYGATFTIIMQPPQVAVLHSRSDRDDRLCYRADTLSSIFVVVFFLTCC